MPRFMYRRRRRLAAKRFVKLQRRWRKKRTLAKRVRNLTKKVNKDLEYRWQDDIAYTEAVPGAGGSGVQIGLDTISTTPTGPLTNDNRLGNNITLTSFYFKGQIINADPSHNFCRLILAEVISLQQIVITSDILEPDPASGNPTLYSPYKKESRIKYKILLDKFYKLQPVVAGAVYPFIANVDLSYKWKSPGLKITYNQAAAQQPIYKNVMLFLLSDSQVLPHPQIRGAKRIQFVA